MTISQIVTHFNPTSKVGFKMLSMLAKRSEVTRFPPQEALLLNELAEHDARMFLPIYLPTYLAI